MHCLELMLWQQWLLVLPTYLLIHTFTRYIIVICLLPMRCLMGQNIFFPDQHCNDKTKLKDAVKQMKNKISMQSRNKLERNFYFYILEVLVPHCFFRGPSSHYVSLQELLLPYRRRKSIIFLGFQIVDQSSCQIFVVWTHPTTRKTKGMPRMRPRT